LSGGIDSAVVAVLCKDALGKDNVSCLFMPDEATPKADRKHVNDIVKSFNLNCKEIDITSLVQKISSVSLKKPDKLALSNIKARTRMILLYEFANMTNSLVCGASNKSELLIGYFTKYGDGGVDFQPLGDLYKTQIYQLSRYLKIPRKIISKPPTAGLWPDQTDEEELGISYEALDRILFGLEHKLDVKEIQKIANVRKADVDRINKMRIKSQHKRRSPLIPKIGLRTPGLDWRTPIQEG